MTASKSIAWLFPLITILWGGTTGKIAGRVAAGVTEEPLAGASITVIGTNLEAVTDGGGDYFILNVPPGEYDVQASLPGYRSVILTGIDVTSDYTSTASFLLIDGKLILVTGRIRRSPAFTFRSASRALRGADRCEANVSRSPLSRAASAASATATSSDGVKSDGFSARIEAARDARSAAPGSK